MSEYQQIENILMALEHPSFVTEIRHVLDTDSAGDPAVWIWVILQDATAESAAFPACTEPVRSTIAQALREAEIDRWPYVRFRGESEQVELDRAEAA